MLDPKSETSDHDLDPLTPRLDSLEGKRVGVFGNGKPPAEPHSRVIVDNLDDIVDDIDIVTKYRDFYDLQDQEGQMDELREWAVEEDLDASILTIGDCGTCTKYTAWATNTMEDLGIPSVGLIMGGLESDFETASREEGRKVRYYVVPTKANRTDMDIISEKFTEEAMADLISRLTDPLTDEEH